MTDAIGGIAQTYNYKGNRIDIGGHRFFSKEKRVMDWWFNIMPRQGKPSADTVEKNHEIEYVAEAVVEYLCKECVSEQIENGKLKMENELQGRTSEQGDAKILNSQFSILNSTKIVQERRTAPDPEKEENVMLQRPRVSRIFYKKNFFPYPIGITLMVAKRLGFFNTFMIGMSYIWRQVFPIKDETYLDAFYRNRFGDRLYATFFEAYTEKVWGVPCSQIRADWGAQRVKGLSLKRAVIHAVKDLLSSDFKKQQEERETSLIASQIRISALHGRFSYGQNVVKYAYGERLL
jgi:protoporphyrinogen oxidase